MWGHCCCLVSFTFLCSAAVSSCMPLHAHVHQLWKHLKTRKWSWSWVRLMFSSSDFWCHRGMILRWWKCPICCRKKANMCTVAEVNPLTLSHSESFLKKRYLTANIYWVPVYLVDHMFRSSRQFKTLGLHQPNRPCHPVQTTQEQNKRIKIKRHKENEREGSIGVKRLQSCWTEGETPWHISHSEHGPDQMEVWLNEL